MQRKLNKHLYNFGCEFNLDMNFIRYPFFFINLLFLILGIAIMAFGILLLTNHSILEDVLQLSTVKNSNYSSVAPVVLQPSVGPNWLMRIKDPVSYILSAFGAFYFTLSFIGYCGSIKDSRGLMVIYALLLIVFIVLQIVGVFLYSKYKPNLKAEMANAINDLYKVEEMQKFSQFEFILDFLMINYKCCGVRSERDFKEVYSHLYSLRSLLIEPRNDHKGEQSKESDSSIFGRVITGEKETLDRQVPVSCCKFNITSEEATLMLKNIYRNQEDKLAMLDYTIDNNCVTKPDETNAYVGDSHGCFDKIQSEISTPLRIGMIIVGLVQLCGLVFAGFIFRTAYYDWFR